jgi:hypothetical protein
VSYNAVVFTRESLTCCEVQEVVSRGSVVYVIEVPLR